MSTVDISRAICRFFVPGSGSHLGAVYGDAVVDLTRRDAPLFGSLDRLLTAPTRALDEALERYAGEPADYSLSALSRTPDPSKAHLLAPLDAQEVWAAGVTYTRSRQARMDESEASADVYARVYDAPRPELFLKATPSRVVGPHAELCVRSDSTWTVPEPELTLLINARLEIVGVTVGNDLTARDIEAQNPLYLPQAKVFERCCALGPVVVPVGSLDPYALTITCRIRRAGNELYSGSTSTAEFHRRLDDLVAYLGRHNQFSGGVYLMTGTGLVPPDNVALTSGDEVEIQIDGIGTLYNTIS